MTEPSQPDKATHRALRLFLHDKLILTAAFAAVAGVAWLQNIPERWPFGYEVGIIISAVAYAYIGAWIFNWVIVSRPRAKLLRDIYQLAWPMLSLAANDGYRLVRELQYLADADPRIDPRDDDITELCKRLHYGSSRGTSFKTSLTDPIKYLNPRFDFLHNRIDALMPLLAKADDELIIALARANNTQIALHRLKNPSHDGKPVQCYSPKEKGHYLITLGDQARHLKEYFDAAENLRKCMESLKYRPGPVHGRYMCWDAEEWRKEKLKELEAAEAEPDTVNSS
ncbi:MAG: hypothetical protein K0U84_08110 [Actinomycetia bacterium]|nr:hypothetical protein [Actinomycetes bacterium]